MAEAFVAHDLTPIEKRPPDAGAEGEGEAEELGALLEGGGSPAPENTCLWRPAPAALATPLPAKILPITHQAIAVR